MLSTQTILLLLFSSVTDCGQIVINLEKLRDLLSSPRLYNFMLDRDIHCFITCTSLYASHQRCDLFTDSLAKTDSDNVSFLGHSVHFSPPLAEKLQGTAIKVSTSTTYWNSFPALCPTLSREDAGSWHSVFVYSNQSCMRLSKAFFGPCADKPVVDVFNYSKRITFSDKARSLLHLNTVVFLVCRPVTPQKSSDVTPELSENYQTFFQKITRAIFNGLIVPVTAQPWENNSPCTWMMQFPYFNRDKGGRALESLLWDPQDVLRKKSALSCTLAFRAREVHGREACTTTSLFWCPQESCWNVGLPPQPRMPWPFCALCYVGNLQLPNRRWHASNLLSWRENGSTRAWKQSRKWKCVEFFFSSPPATESHCWGGWRCKVTERKGKRCHGCL